MKLYSAVFEVKTEPVSEVKTEPVFEVKTEPVSEVRNQGTDWSVIPRTYCISLGIALALSLFVVYYNRLA